MSFPRVERDAELRGEYEYKVMCVIYKLGTKAADLPRIGITIVCSSLSFPYTYVSTSQHMMTYY